MAPAATNTYVDSLTVARKAHATVIVDEEIWLPWNPPLTHKLKVAPCILSIRNHSSHMYTHLKKQRF